MATPAGELSPREAPAAQQLKPRRAKAPWEEIFLIVGSAAIITVLLDALIRPPQDPAEFARRILNSGVRLVVAVLFGMYLGRRVWPARGRGLGLYLLRRSLKGTVSPAVFLTDRPDFAPSTPRRIMEVVGFVAGTSILVSSGLALAGLQAFALPVYLYALVALWASFLLVPYWTFARMGLRRVDPVRWIIEPLSRRYANRLKLSNGTLVIIALGASINLAIRAGQSGDEALITSVRLLAQLIAAILVVAASGVAYFARVERGLFLSLEQSALDLGVRDGRAMNDGEFLPRTL